MYIYTYIYNSEYLVVFSLSACQSLVIVIIIINFNRPDVTFMNKKTKNTILIDIAVQNTHNLAETITGEQNKYQELGNEICAMWKQKVAQVIPIVISSAEVIPKS